MASRRYVGPGGRRRINTTLSTNKEGARRPGQRSQKRKGEGPQGPVYVYIHTNYEDSSTVSIKYIDMYGVPQSLKSLHIRIKL